MAFFEDRSWLLIKAIILRLCMKIGLALGNRAPPRCAPAPSFSKTIPSRISSRPGWFKLLFYVPETYYSCPRERRFPLVLNFHGGGFTIGSGTDDARWARSVVENTESVLVSVEYRLAPEYPFSVGVEDGVDALIYLAAHANELRLDPHQIALSGFSAGGNLAFTVPLMFHELQVGVGKRTLEGQNRQAPRSSPSKAALLMDNTSTTSPLPSISLSAHELEPPKKIPPLTVLGIISFYPVVDFRPSNQDKRKTNPRPEYNTPTILDDLFDQAYLSPAHTTVQPFSLSDPYLSPAAASDALLAAALPPSIILYTCEYDELNAEGVAFGERLKSAPIGKRVSGGLIRGVDHAFDKKPKWRFPERAERCYAEACEELRAVFWRESMES